MNNIMDRICVRAIARRSKAKLHSLSGKRRSGSCMPNAMDRVIYVRAVACRSIAKLDSYVV